MIIIIIISSLHYRKTVKDRSGFKLSSEFQKCSQPKIRLFIMKRVIPKILLGVDNPLITDFQLLVVFFFKLVHWSIFSPPRLTSISQLFCNLYPLWCTRIPVYGLYKAKMDQFLAFLKKKLVHIHYKTDVTGLFSS